MSERKKGRALDKLPRDYTIIDIETSGFSPEKNHIIEVGCIKYRDGQEINRYSSLICPPCRISTQIERLTGITNEMISSAPTFKMIARALWKYLSDETLVGHNVNFDISFLYSNFERELGQRLQNDYVDTLTLCRKALPDLENHKLPTVSRALQINIKPHRALSDCMILSKVLERITVVRKEPIKVIRGQKVDVTKTNPTLRELVLKVGWRSSGGMELDAAAFLLDDSGRAPNDSAMVFYNQPINPSGSVEHVNVENGAQFKIILSRIPPTLARIDVTLTIYDAEQRRQTFQQFEGGYVSVLDGKSGVELLRYDLVDDYSCETAIILCEIYRHGSEWKFNAIGSGFAGGLGALVKNFGLQVQEQKASLSATLSATVKADVKMLAAIRNCTISEIVNDALNEYLQSRRHEIDEVIARRSKVSC